MSSWSGLMCLAVGCGGGGDGSIPAPDGAPSRDGSPGTGIGAGSARCSFELIEDAKRTTWSGTPRARMNGSGNLLVVCEGPTGSSLELHFGNATFDGPRTYKADDFLSDGSLEFRPSEKARSMSSSDKGSSCSLVLTQAPLDPDGSSVPTGATIAATFTCAKLGASAVASVLTIEGGDLLVTVE